MGGCEETQNHLYGTFTAAKPRRINVGHRRVELLEKMDEYAYTSDERAVIVGNVDEVPDSQSMSVTDVNEDSDDAMLPDDGVTSKRLKVERS